MDFSRYSHIFMIGVGGIGMSALARFFRLSGKTVAGYDRTRTQLTGELENEGINIIYTTSVEDIEPAYKNTELTLGHLHSGHQIRKPAVAIFHSKLFHHCQAIGNFGKHFIGLQNHCSFGHAWQNFDLYHDRAPAPSVGKRLHCTAGRDFKELPDQFPFFRKI
jgi:hypothetical protein